MEVDTPDDATFFISITLNTNINETEYMINKQNEETQNLLLLLISNQGI